MARAGILTADDAVELLEGWLVQKMTKNPRHRIAVRLLFEALLQATPPGWYADSQEPITLADSEPEPDAVIVRGRTVDYASRHPGAQDVALVVEVAEATLSGDRARKKRIYARAGIPVYWLVNLVDNVVEVYSQPLYLQRQGSDYRRREAFGLDDQLSLVIEGITVGQISVGDFLPPEEPEV